MPRWPKCKICGEDVIKTEQEYYQNTRGYFHQSCRDQKQSQKTEGCTAAGAKKNSVKCYYCGEQVPTGERVKNDKGYNFHPNCLKEYDDRRNLFDYCCYIWGLKAPGPVITRQAKQFKEKGLTYKGMLLTLKYFYETQRNDRTKYKGKETIGIIPYVYDEAKSYYESLEKKKAELVNETVTQEIERIVIKKKKGQTSRPPLYDF